MFAQSTLARPLKHIALRALLATAASMFGLTGSSAFAATVGGSASLTSDYVWRGSSQSDGDPAAQAGVKVMAESGWYGSGWGSTVKFPGATDAHSELDLSAGWSDVLSRDLSLDINLTHYLYPSTSLNLDWTEAIATLSWRQNQWLMLGYSNDALASGENGVYAQLGAKIRWGDRWRVEAAAGGYWLDTESHDRYAHAQLSGIWILAAPFELRLTAHATEGDAQRLFAGAAGTRAEVALQASF